MEITNKYFLFSAFLRCCSNRRTRKEERRFNQPKYLDNCCIHYPDSGRCHYVCFDNQEECCFPYESRNYTNVLVKYGSRMYIYYRFA